MKDKQILFTLKNIVLSDFISDQEKQEIFDLVLNYNGSSPDLIKILDDFLTAKVKSKL